ncbi:efflux RND transporter permease subunit [Phormidium sp. LEGE 05292]|uniref:efflux RND transporter permease subunit n=1 Tax=[Phormidium] sp. LEGE 05292 TaxID=767427 RepID=UPI001882C863|nr:efflux RND transporter permease subunit [Phormidium sp. LEGE 05292]MBE9225639.1 efflux RND transporter permease subunit [Phormidium sp. LEGE 05292]
MQKPTPKVSKREKFNISRVAIAHPRFTIGFWIAVVVAGLLAFSSLKYALFPNITFPVVVVSASSSLPQATEVEAKLTIPIEQSVENIPRRKSTNSSSYPQQSLVNLSFNVGTNLAAAEQQVKTALQKLTLPAGTKLNVIPINLNESAVVSYAIDSSTKNLTQLTEIAQKQIVPSISKLPGVGKVNLLGGTTGNADKSTSAVRFNGNDALAFQVVKTGDANALEVTTDVEKQVEELRSQLPDVKIILAATQADYIKAATQATIDALIEAIVLSVIVIYPFLWNWRATFISALAIPISLLGTFIVMAFFGFNLETITLLALALVIGSIIDDAIVDVENITRHVENGESPRNAALNATREIGLTVTATTLTAVAVFLPIALMRGVIGQFFQPFGITVSAAMIASWLVARTLSPVLAIYWIKCPGNKGTRREQRIWLNFAQGYRQILKWSLGHRRIVIGIATLSLIVGVALIPFIPKGFIPKLDRGEFNISYTAPLSVSSLLPSWLQVPGEQNDPLQESLDVAKQLEAAVLKAPEVTTVYTTVGTRPQQPNHGNLYVKLNPERRITTAEFQDKIRQQLPQLPGVSTSIEDIQFIDTGGQKPLQIGLIGEDLAASSKAAREIKAEITKIPGLEDVSLIGATDEQGAIFQIERNAQQRVVNISANLGQGITIGEATDRILAIANPIIPPGVTLSLGGDSARSNEIFTSFGTTLILSALCILVILLLLFKNWSDPFVVGLSLPLALVGALLALFLTNSDFGMISLIGFVFLLGISNKNAILLVDYINQLRNAKMERNEAILTAGPVRLRPIMMTTASTILGMLPLALNLGAGSELRSPMAIAIAGGLVSSTILSLIVVPVVYTLLDDFRSRFKLK